MVRTFWLDYRLLFNAELAFESGRRPVRILAFLQNQWFKNPEKVKKILAREDEAFRLMWIDRMLFYRCLTGKRLKAALGEDLCEQIIWEEISREIGGHAASVFPADLQHMVAAIRQHQPQIVLTFGVWAANAIEEIARRYQQYDFHWVKGMHPSARHPDVMQSLKEAARQLRQVISEFPPQSVPNAADVRGDNASAASSNIRRPAAPAGRQFEKLEHGLTGSSAPYVGGGGC